MPGVVNPGGNIGSAGVPASASASGPASATANSVVGPEVPTGTPASNTPAAVVTPGNDVASKLDGSAPVGPWSR